MITQYTSIRSVLPCEKLLKISSIYYFVIPYSPKKQLKRLRICLLSENCIHAVLYFPMLRRSVLDTTLCHKVCQLLAAGRDFLRVLWFPPSI